MNDQRYFLLKKLHSLSGVVPVAGFVIFHLFENSNSVAGPEAFNHVVKTLRGFPYLYLLEIGLIGPIIFHAALGIYISTRAKYNVGLYANRSNYSYFFQRLSGWYLLAFITYHLLNTRFAGVAADQMFQHLQVEYARPGVFWFYVGGLLTAAFHLGNGIWGFCFSWGIVTGQKSQDKLWMACMGLAVAVFLMGLNALLGFNGHGVNIFQPVGH